MRNHLLIISSDKIRHVDIFWHEDTVRSVDGGAIHSRPEMGDNYIKGKEALINCLLLSRCNVLIRTASFLSAWSSFFNPKFPVIMLNTPYEHKLWFPDREIIKCSIKEYSLDMKK